MSFTLTALLICFPLVAAAADGHHLLFESGKEGYPRYRIPSLVVTKGGTLLAVCEGRVDGGGLTGNVDLVCKRSRDNGKTWSELGLVADLGDDTVGNQSVVVDRGTGAIWIAHTISPGEHLEAAITRGETDESTRVFVIHSRDEGRTWSKPREITSSVKRSGWTWYGCGPGVGIQLQSGRLLFPCYHAEGDAGQTYRSHVIFSDDHGQSWKLGGDAGLGNGEPQVLQREDGALYMSARTAQGGPHVRSIIESRDDGATWSEKRYDESLFDAHCQASLLKLPPHDGRPRWLYCHPAGPTRHNLTVRLSRDEGKTWNAGSLLLREGDAQYSSMALLPDGRVGVLYDCWENGNYQLYFTTFAIDEIRSVPQQEQSQGREPQPNQPAKIDWNQQAAADATEDFTTVIFDGRPPDQLACDTTVRAMPDGSWVTVMLGGGNAEPLPANRVFISRSQDQGRTWTPMQPIDLGVKAKNADAALVPSELMVHGDRCTLFVATHDGTFADWKEWMTHSDDSCRTWSKLEPAPGRLHDRTFIRNHIVTRDGRMLLPFQHYLRVADTRTISNNRRFSPPADPRNGVLMSDDGGKTWTEHGNIRLTDNDDYHGWAENNIVELSDGTIAMIIRADGLGGVLYCAESKDGGRTWPALAQKTDIPNPGSKATLYSLGGDTVALLHNPNPRHRSPLSLWISFDGLKTWPYGRVLVPQSRDGPQGRLNYPDGFVSADGRFLNFAYDDNRHRCVFYRAKLPDVK